VYVPVDTENNSKQASKQAGTRRNTEKSFLSTGTAIIIIKMLLLLHA